MMEARLVVASVLEDQAVLFGLFGLFIVLFCFYLGWVFRRWSWVPRHIARRRYAELGMRSEELGMRETPLITHCVKDENGNVIGNLKRGDQVKICGYTWTIM